MKDHFYILDKEGNVKPVKEVLEWAEWFEIHKRERIIRQTNLFGIWVSTVFLGLDHNFEGGLPLVFETMIFGGVLDGYQDRYSTKQEAKKGHWRFVWLVIKTLPQSLIEYIKYKLGKE